MALALACKRSLSAGRCFEKQHGVHLGCPFCDQALMKAGKIEKESKESPD